MMNSGKHLYRILRFDHAVQVLKGELYFSHPSQWDDPYETHVKHDYDHAIFAQCWTTASMSDAMWRIYSPDFLGVRIRTTAGKLKQALLTYTGSHKGFKRRLEQVQYLQQGDYKGEIAQLELLMSDVDFSGPSIAADLLCRKRSAFKHENEVRAILFNSKAERSESGLEKGIVVGVDGVELIDSVLFDPRAPDELCNAMRHYLKDVLKFPGDVRKSKLYTLSSR